MSIKDKLKRIRSWFRKGSEAAPPSSILSDVNIKAVKEKIKKQFLRLDKNRDYQAIYNELKKDDEFKKLRYKVLKEINKERRSKLSKEEKERFDDLLIRRAEEGEILRVIEALVKGADVNDRDELDRTALMHAAKNGHPEIVKLLIEIGADVNARNKRNITALMIAALNGHTEIAKVLIDNGADVNARDELDSTALMRAAEYGHVEVVKVLIDNGARLDVIASYGFNLLMAAAKGGCYELAKLLIEKKVFDVNARDKDDQTALMHAAKYGHTEVVKLLIENGANPFLVNKEGKTAYDYGKYKIKQLLNEILTTKPPSALLSLIASINRKEKANVIAFMLKNCMGSEKILNTVFREL